MANTNINPKLPPQNLEAEQAVLGALMIDKEALYKVSDFLRPEDFYREENGLIYQTILELADDKQPIDVLTLTNALEKKRQLKNIGGASHITQIVNSTPTAANITSYARIIKDRAVLRNLISAGSEIAELGFQEGRQTTELLDEAERALYKISQTFLKQAFVPIKEVLAGTFERIDELHKTKGKIRGVPTGYKALDNILAGLQKSDMIVLAARPSMGKTSLAISIVINAAVKYKIPVGFFSIEQSRDQIVDRMLVSVAGIDSWRLRTGNLSDSDFPKIGQAMGTLSEAPIFIDDTPTLNIVEMRAKARRLQAEHNLEFLVIDYMQLMEASAPNREGSRVQEMSEISRGIKAVARELNVPVLALSQLSRAVEMRQPKIPQLADLRESGCLTGDTRLIDADSGELVPIKNLVGRKDFKTFSLDENLKLIKRRASKIFFSGRKVVFKLTTALGKEIKASANHPFLGLFGWKRLDELKEGDKIALPRLIPFSWSSQKRLDKHKLILLAHYLTSGKRNPTVKQLDKELKIFNQRSGEKVIPRIIFQQPPQNISLFLRRLWARGGSITKSKYGNQTKWSIFFGGKSKRLSLGVQELLFRLGIISTIRENKKTGFQSNWDCIIEDKHNQLKFLERVGIFGQKQKRLQEAKRELGKITSHSKTDIIPKEIWQYIATVKNNYGLSWRDVCKKLEIAPCGTRLFKSDLPRARLKQISKFIPDQSLIDLARSDLYWDRIISIDKIGVEEVYDVTIPKNHNFVANGIIVENSIEQDADVVMFIYREDYYKEDSERKNIADILVKKHRNGPTGSVELYFVPEQMKFQDLEKRRTKGEIGIQESAVKTIEEEF